MSTAAMTWVLILLVSMPDGSGQRVQQGTPHPTLEACEAAKSAAITYLGFRATCEARQ
jgi:hypothetical protein